jgi:MFS family permease
MVLVYQLENKRSNLTYMMWGTFLIAISFLLLGIAPLLSLVIFSMLVVTLGEMLLFPFTNSFWVSRTHSYNRGQYAAVYSMSFAIAQVLSPILSSLVVAKAGFSILFGIDFILCSLAALGFLWLRKKV